jgi:predicted ATPase
MAPDAVLARMGDRFRLLASSGVGRGRHATLRATLDWSWEQLADWERSALAQLSVFAGSFALEAVEAVVDLESFESAPWAVDALQALVEKSLVRVLADDRFELFTSVREYADEHLRSPGRFAG